MDCVLLEETTSRSGDVTQTQQEHEHNEAESGVGFAFTTSVSSSILVTCKTSIRLFKADSGRVLLPVGKVTLSHVKVEGDSTTASPAAIELW